MTCLRVMNLQIVLDALFHRFIFTKEEQWNGGECKEHGWHPDKRPANTVQTGGSLWLVGNIAKAVHNPGGEGGADTTAHLDAEGTAEGD